MNACLSVQNNGRNAYVYQRGVCFTARMFVRLLEVERVAFLLYKNIDFIKIWLTEPTIEAFWCFNVRTETIHSYLCLTIM